MDKIVNNLIVLQFKLFHQNKLCVAWSKKTTFGTFIIFLAYEIVPLVIFFTHIWYAMYGMATWATLTIPPLCSAAESAAQQN
jgi:hypothetical protein